MASTSRLKPLRGKVIIEYNLRMDAGQTKSGIVYNAPKVQGIPHEGVVYAAGELAQKELGLKVNDHVFFNDLKPVFTIWDGKKLLVTGYENITGVKK